MRKVCLILLTIGVADVGYAGNKDTTVDDTKVTQTERFYADHWGLTVAEWRRYQQLMGGIIGKRNPNMDPLTALGLYARTEEERLRMAELFIQTEHDFWRRYGQWQEAIASAEAQHYPDAKMIDMERYDRVLSTYAGGKGLSFNGGSTRANREYLLFVTPDCAECDEVYQKVKNYPNRGHKLNIYFTDATDRDIRQWAFERKISPAAVKKKQITLNHAGELAGTLSVSEVPVLYQASNNGEGPKEVDLP